MNLEIVRLEELLSLGRGRQASDLHIGAGSTPKLRLHGNLVSVDVPPLSSEALEGYLARELPRSLAARWQATGLIDAVDRSGAGAPYRLHAYRSMSGIRLAFRFLAQDVPALEALALPEIVSTFAGLRHGLIVFTGPTGSGKTTALAGLLDRINRTVDRVVVTVEDPVEYVHSPVRSVIAHCEIGNDVDDYATAVHGFMRADPDVILVGEMRECSTMEAALSAAETGHLVLSSLHTNDAAQTIDRVIDAFASSAQIQIRTQLAATLVAVVSLRLVPLCSGEGRILAAEVLIGTDAVRAMIRDGKTHQLRNAIATGRAAGMRTLETSLSDLVVRRMISIDVARDCSNRPSEVRDLTAIAG
jgi:twitching motility protein PilT